MLTTREYVPGNSAAERQRLGQQGSVLAEFTDQVLREAGLAPGMRVLDLGCGVGDVSLLAARIVGPEGSITGIDRDAAALSDARVRAERAGLRNVIFIQQAVEALRLPAHFDAVIGRLILMHLAQPEEGVRRAIELLAPGGVAAFVETDMEIGGRSEPPVPLYDRCLEWIRITMQRSGVHTGMGMGLYRCFRAAGLPTPQLRLQAGVGGGPDFFAYPLYAGMVRTILPRMEGLGIASAEEVEIDTLEERMRAEAISANAQIVTTPIIAAWARAH
jgi:SAM-dependent methyltransferase